METDFQLSLGSWTIDHAPFASISGTCKENNNTAFGGDEPEYWSACGSWFGPNTYTVSQLANGSYALAGRFPGEFDNALGFSPSDTGLSMYQFIVDFIHESGTCEVFVRLIVGLGRTKDEFQIIM